MRRHPGFYFFVGFSMAFTLSSIGSALILRAHAQERDWTYPQTYMWRLAEDTGRDTGVTVIDTAGVCLYVAERWDNRAAASIAAVPKTQLPKGAGCQ